MDTPGSYWSQPQSSQHVSLYFSGKLQQPNKRVQSPHWLYVYRLLTSSKFKLRFKLYFMALPWVVHAAWILYVAPEFNEAKHICFLCSKTIAHTIKKQFHSWSFALIYRISCLSNTVWVKYLIHIHWFLNEKTTT